MLDQYSWRVSNGQDCSTLEACMKLEIAVVSAAGAAVAITGGADRVELCSALELGGLTPSQGLAVATLERLAQLASEAGPGDKPAGVHPLIRCRPGDFSYSQDDVNTMVEEVKALLGIGCAGVVVGALLPDGRLDRDAVARMADAARETSPTAELTFHRAMDQVPDALGLIDELADLGFTRILTSGQAATAGAGIDMLRKMAEHADGRLQIMAGGGLKPSDIPAMYDAGVQAVHLSAKRMVSGNTSAVAVGSADSAAYQVTDQEIVRAAAMECASLPTR